MISAGFLVALGGAVGAVLRWLTGVCALRLIGPGFPWGTLAVNVLGSFLMGVVVVLLTERMGDRLAPFLMTGVLGGFTTFSAFSLDAVRMIEGGQMMQAGIYVGASVGLALLALFAGLIVTRMMI
ncbi:fluoride efflux transporter CrcB [Loktanella sp. SALINAS62]|uniref:fluoride efflux transporter CrcB n=1 Tax=Loktanella sp. SALINAS62 TaxID=2706124 RepID=UPI001B8C61CB|nr:fluoride efflux transporter CrcB [Loktanella sp. SALINAS62]MBS1301448.1 fluoride efflux transporter CrcB [Loktanella sp. SALINAS62]